MKTVSDEERSSKMEKRSTVRVMTEVLLAAVVAVVMFWAMPGILRENSADYGPERAVTIEDGWYVEEDGVKKDITLPADIELPEDGRLVLSNDSLTQEDAGKVITTKGAMDGFTMYMDDTLIYEYSDEEFPRNDQMKSKHNCDAMLPDDGDIGTLSLRYEGEPGDTVSISSVYIGSESAVMWLQFTDVAVIILISLVFVVLSVAAVCVAVYLCSSRIQYRRFIDTAVFLFICNVWFMTDTSFVQMLARSYANVCVVSFYAFMLMAIPMLHFVKHTGEMSRYRILDVMILLFYANAAVQGILHMTAGIEFRDMLLVTHVLLIAAVAVCLVLMLKEYSRDKTKEAFMILTAFCILGASGVISIFLYWLLKIPYYGSIFQLGILVFVIIIISVILMAMTGNIKYKMEAQVSLRMSRRDSMTGLEKREPFEEYLQQLQMSMDRYRDLMLIFISVSELKAINDRLGHAAGDEVVLGASKCIGDVFGSAGRCYRTGGNEFAVVIADPESDGETMTAWLKDRVQQYNRESRHVLDIAAGYSCVRRPDGTLKTISDWKYEANKNMIRDKEKGGAYEQL